jgi:hypothetical protein
MLDLNKKWFRIIYFILAGVFVFGLIFFVDLKFDINRPEETPQNSAKPSQGNTVFGEVFYSKDNNIFLYNIGTKTETKLTDYSTKETLNIKIQGIRVINEKYLSFVKCDIVTGNYGCGLYILDLKTKDIVEKKKLDKSFLVTTFDFASPNKFAYLAISDSKWQMFLSDNGNTKILEDVEIGNGYGRGGYIEDSEKIRFSEDEKYLFHISTSSPRNIQDFNVHIFDLVNNSEQVISNATQPDSYNPTVLNNKILYADNSNKQIWLYDLNTKKNEIVVKNAINPFWISPTVAGYTKVKCAQENDCKNDLDYEIISIDIFDLNVNSKVGSIPDLILDITTKYD